ncbi:hypothetical protein FA13DRAFT_562218 [Coprinellus micaceus]|uniref:Uncharacterized protein n=1 Tax=Coprinellus micaceus TaxID=71717 RepID=A0A4Y7SBF0_COPMI|nr:hypothetical protein FA13DRAFT_562218 [Coprinellus micaceus]
MRSPLTISSFVASDLNAPALPLPSSKPLIKRRRLGLPSSPASHPLSTLPPANVLQPISPSSDQLASISKVKPNQTCVSCYKSLAILPPSQVAQCSRCQASMCTICSRTCTSLPPRAPTPAPPCAPHTVDRGLEDRRAVRRLPRRGRRGAPLRSIPTQIIVDRPSGVQVQMDCSMEDFTESGAQEDGARCPDGSVPHVHRRDSNASDGYGASAETGRENEGEKEREGCGRVVCKGCAVEDLSRGGVACRGCVEGR